MKYLIFDEQVECRSCRQPNLCLNFAWNFALVTPTKFPEFRVEIPSWQANKFLNFPRKFRGNIHSEATCAVKYEISNIWRAGWAWLLSSAHLMPEIRVELRSCDHNKFPEFRIEIPSWQANHALVTPTNSLNFELKFPLGKPTNSWSSLLASQQIPEIPSKFRGNVCS